MECCSKERDWLIPRGYSGPYRDHDSKFESLWKVSLCFYVIIVLKAERCWQFRYDSLLSRAHSNYLAQINIRMNERQEKTSDILGKLTVLGTIVLPMNIVTGMWGMNVLVPGQDDGTLWWFWCIATGLFMFGFGCFFIAKRVYGIV